jgi:hypothetical protein
VEHAEIFWSLFAVDMNSVLEQQPADTWDSFTLFQMLNDYLRTDGMSQLGYSLIGKARFYNKHEFWAISVGMCVSAENLCGGRFHTHLREVFAPQVIRYVDLMESSIAQSIHKGFEKETWKPQG